MVHFELQQTSGVLMIRPEDSLEAADFERIGREVDPYIEANGKLHGLMIDAKSFPGWKDFGALIAHLRFVKDHHRKIERIAVVSDSSALTIMPKIASHFVKAEIRHFAQSQSEEALNWLRVGT
jgi:hypothetical protein